MHFGYNTPVTMQLVGSIRIFGDAIVGIFPFDHFIWTCLFPVQKVINHNDMAAHKLSKPWTVDTK